MAVTLVAAVAQILKDVPLAEGRVFHVEIPQSELSEMPRRCITVRGSGGSQTLSQHWMKTGDIRVDVKCFAATPWDAAQLEGEAAAVLQAFEDSTVTVDGEEGRVLWATQSGGPNQLRDPDTDWPYSLSTWQVYGIRYA